MTQPELENLYLRAKIAYYEGNDIMTDVEFDTIEAQLRDMGSKVMEQVGSKRKDFDLAHPNKMLSLAKIQMEEVDNKKSDFLNWYNKRLTIINQAGNIDLKIMLEWTPKFDGNAINCIYKGGELVEILTRGDGFTGKDITNKLRTFVPQNIGTLPLTAFTELQTIEIRCEVVMPSANFEKINNLREANGQQLFANARNFVAGLLGKDEIETDTLKQLKILPLHLLVDGEHRPIQKLTGWADLMLVNEFAEGYDEMISEFERVRSTFEVGLDGVVISFPPKYRKLLGENSHDPEWAIAIKFVPIETIATVKGFEWNVSKTGELSPVVLFEPVALDGTMVKRASGYNAGYIINNKLGIGAKVSLAKAGDIIPEIQKIIIPSNSLDVLPDECPICGYPVSFDGIHLVCSNETCEGKMLKRLGVGLGVFDIKRVGGRTIAPFVGHFDNFVELFIWVRKNTDNPSAFEPFDFKLDSRSLEIFIDGFKNIKSISAAKIIQALGYDEVGNSISPELAKWYCGFNADFKGFEKAIVEKMKQTSMQDYITNLFREITSCGVEVEYPKAIVDLPKNIIFVEMTGSPKPNWKTKEEFLKVFSGRVIHTGLNDRNCLYLLTDDYASTSNKMADARKRKIEIMSYEDFYYNQTK